MSKDHKREERYEAPEDRPKPTPFPMNQVKNEKFTVKTWVEDKTIIQETFDSIVKRTIRRVANTEDEQIRNALIALGWTPPEED